MLMNTFILGFHLICYQPSSICEGEFCHGKFCKLLLYCDYGSEVFCTAALGLWYYKALTQCMCLFIFIDLFIFVRQSSWRWYCTFSGNAKKTKKQSLGVQIQSCCEVKFQFEDTDFNPIDRSIAEPWGGSLLVLVPVTMTLSPKPIHVCCRQSIYEKS